MNRNDRRILKIARERKLKFKDVPNKLHQITHQTAPKRPIKINPKGVTVLIKDNEVL